MDSVIYRWNGRYWGFVVDGRLFNARSNYAGWIDVEGRVWRRNGAYLGKLVDDEYILRRRLSGTLTRRTPPTPPEMPHPRVAEPDRPARPTRVGYADPLKDL